MRSKKKYILIFSLFIITCCSKNFDKPFIVPAQPFKAAKIEGKHNIFISNKKFSLNTNFQSEDCESWSVNLDFDKPLRVSIESLLDKMFDDYSISPKRLSKSEIEENNFVSQIYFYDFKGISKFKTERNTGKYDIALKIKIRVENSMKNITNEISSNMNWEKNIFLNCNLNEGAVKSGQKALDNLLKNIYESTYESLYQVIK